MSSTTDVQNVIMKYREAARQAIRVEVMLGVSVIARGNNCSKPATCVGKLAGMSIIVVVVVYC